MKNISVSDFESCKNICVVGLSSNSKKFGNALFQHLDDSGYKVSGVSRNVKSENVYASIKEVPLKPELVVLAIKSKESLPFLKDCKDLGIDKVFLVSGSYDKDVLEYCKNNNISAIYKSCPFMHFNTTSFHGFHKKLKSFFGLKPHII
jgi:uncharacterized protein